MAGHRNIDTLKRKGDPASRDRARRALQDRDVRTVTSLGELRARHGLTQVQLAERMERSQAQVSRIESGADPHLSTIAEYVDALGARLDLVVTLEDGATMYVELKGAYWVGSWFRTARSCT